jgi:hypothetical protein
MAERKSRRRLAREHFVRGIGESTRHNSLAYGYSLALTGAFGALDAQTHHMTVVDILLFGIGGAVTFTIMSATVTRGFTVRVEGEPPIVLALGASMGFLSITAAIGAAALLGWLLPDWLGWLVGAFAASTVYLVSTAIELSFARGVRALLGREHLRER